VVRVQARRLRAKLEEYYRAAAPGGVRIGICRASQRGGGAGAGFRETRSNRIFFLAAAAVLAVGAAVLAMWGGRNEPRTERLFTTYPGYQTTPVFSPDGTTIGFSWGGENADNIDIYVQRLDADSPRRITTSPTAERRPAWLPDGQSIGFLRDKGPGKVSVVVVSLLGGGERTLAELQVSIEDPPPIVVARRQAPVHQRARRCGRTVAGGGDGGC
jgi:hypothetical protein